MKFLGLKFFDNKKQFEFSEPSKTFANKIMSGGLRRRPTFDVSESGSIKQSIRSSLLFFFNPHESDLKILTFKISNR